MQHLSASIKSLLLALCITATAFSAQAQWVSIPDTNFGKWLKASVYSPCLQGNSKVGWQMDTTCNEVMSEIIVSCGAKGISSLEGIQYFDNLEVLHCNSNQLTTLPKLPNTLSILHCFDNQLTILPPLPDSLTYLYCYNNSLTVLPLLPNTLYSLACSNNQLATLPSLSNSLLGLNCSGNQLATLPPFPSSLLNIDCTNNQLTTLPPLPDSLLNLYCFNNAGLSCLPKLNKIRRINFSNTAITCLPNYPQNIVSSTPPLNSIPICDLFNASNCDVYYNISGKVFYDSIPNCVNDVSEKEGNAKVLLYKNGVLEQQTILKTFGSYSFDTSIDSFEIRIDTIDVPYEVTCPSIAYHAVNLTLQDSVKTSMNFGLRCKASLGFDIGVVSAVRDSGTLFPSQKAGIQIKAGDINQFFGLNCAAGISGKVVVVYSGSASYSGFRPGALTPTVTGKILTYTIADFGAIDISTAFGLIFLTDTFAQFGDQLCLSITVIPDVAGDNNNTNNTLRICFPIVNSYDPNMKEVSPVNSIAPTEDWLTYTIHFQNMGNAPAIHIYVMDTLDNNLDESSIQILGSSHRMLTEIKGKIARFNFPNINLVDSATNEPESKGWLQYKIKKNTNLALGTQIKNTASIYFDFNAPVVTNTVTNTVAEPSNIKENRNQLSEIRVFPNPTEDVVYIDYGKNTTAEATFFNINGATCLKQQLTASNQSISLSGLPAGVYFVSVEMEGSVVRKKVVKY